MALGNFGKALILGRKSDFWDQLLRWPIGGQFGSGTTTTLTAEQGSFTLTGQSALFQVQAVLAQGSFALSGQDAVFQTTAVCGHGTFTLTGQSALFETQIALGQGSFALSGQDVIFETDVIGQRGTFTLTGQDTTFTISAALGYGEFALTGQEVSFSLTSVLGHGRFDLLGQSISFDLGIGNQVDRGFDETLVAFGEQHRRETEEKELVQLLELENRIIAEAFKPFVRMKDAA